MELCNNAIVFPDHRRLKGRKARHGRRRLWSKYDDYCAGRISFAELDAVVQGWVNYVRFADTWGLRRAVFEAMPLSFGARNIEQQEKSRETPLRGVISDQ